MAFWFHLKTSSAQKNRRGKRHQSTSQLMVALPPRRPIPISSAGRILVGSVPIGVQARGAPIARALARSTLAHEDFVFLSGARAAMLGQRWSATVSSPPYQVAQ